jgi:tetratricopeptide (TPR) repeat protein
LLYFLLFRYPGDTSYYAGFWDRWRESPEWDRLYAPVLATLTATFEPIPLHLLKEWAQVDMGLFELRRLLKEQWGAFMYEQDGVFRFYHASLRDFLAGQVDRKKFALPIEGLLDELRERGKKAHRHIASHLFPLTEGGKMQELVNDSHQYCLRYLPRHLHVLGSADDLYALLESASWRTAKIKFDPSYYALAQDVELSLNLSRSALEAAIAQHQPIQHVFSLLSPFCAHSLFLSILQETASNIPPQLLGVLAHLDQTETALGYAELLHSPDSYRYIAEALEATGRSSEATDVRRRMAAARTDAMGPSKRYPGSQQDESSLTAVRELLAQEDSHTALKRAKSIRSEEERNRALSSVALFVARKGDGEEAQGIAHGITDPRDRVVILALIAKASYERNNNNLAHSCMSNAIRFAESIPGGFEQAHAFIAIAKALASFTTLESNEITEKDLAIKLAHQATVLAEADSDLHDQAITLVSVAECFLDLKETGAARRVIEKAYNIATAMIRKDRTLFHEESDTRQFFFDPSSSWNYNAPLGVHVMEELPHLFASVGDIERAQEVMKQVIHAAKRIGSGHLGSRLIPEDIVRWLALQGPPYLVKKVAKEVLPTGELEASLWFAAGSLLEEGQFEDALAFIEDGRIAPGRPRYEIVETLTNAAMWLVKSKQFIRAQQISEMAIEYAQDVPTATSFIWLLSGIARGLKRPQLQEITHAVVHFALQAGWSIYRPHRWLLIHDCIDALLEASTADQATQLAQWIVKTAVTHKEEMEANEDNGIREMWVTMLRMAAKAYASAGNIDQAIATIDRFGDEYGKGRRYLYALGEVYVSLKKSELHERMEEFRQDVHVFANSMLAYAKELLSLDSDDAFANGMITDTLVTLARIDAVDRALEEAKKIQDSYYRALCLGTIVYEAAPNHRLGEYVDIAQQILAYAKEMRKNGRSVLCVRTIKALARIGRVDLAEQAIRKYWLADERFQMSIDAFGKVTRVDSASEPKYWDQNAFADILAEMILCGSQWSAYVIADLFIQGYFRVWEDLAAVAPAFSLMNAADDLWQRIRKLMIPSGELKISQDMCDEMGIIDIFSDVRTVH